MTPNIAKALRRILKRERALLAFELAGQKRWTFEVGKRAKIEPEIWRDEAKKVAEVLADLKRDIADLDNAIADLDRIAKQ